MHLTDLLQKQLTGILLLILIFFGILQPAEAQTNSGQPDIDHQFQISFVPGVSTSDSYSTSRFSFNILGGYNGAFHGFEAGSVFNSNRYDVSGVQLSGLANINKQNANGVFMSGLLNYTGTFDAGVKAGGLLNVNRGRAKGVLLAGKLNYTRQFSSGMMAAGAFNISRSETNGVLLAGGMNIAGNQQSGLMMAGAMNLSEEAHGVSISPLNMTENHTGVQVGVINITGRHSGTQVGVINVVGEESEGTSVGLLSFVEGGRFNADVWSGETGFINGGFRLGTTSIYNVVSIGYNPFHGNDLWQVGLGIGYHQELDEKGNGIETDLIHYNVNYKGKWTPEMSMQTQWRIHYTHSFTDGVGIFIGPSINFSILDEELSSSHIPYSVYDHSSGSNNLRWWAGWTIGLELL